LGGSGSTGNGRLFPTKPSHLADAVAALDITLTDEEIRVLEEPYTPRQPTGY
jgi:1-deoxyxylulose-5-phosphate synthase